jgi:CheY-like chemotaxis protein
MFSPQWEGWGNMTLCSVLIVDDSATDRYLLKRQIHDAQIAEKIFEADDGSTALDFLKDYDENYKKYPGQVPPIIIFLDINMPLIGGLEFLEHFAVLRQSKDFSSCVLIMFTSSERETDRKQALSYDFVRGYLVKMPSSPEVLRQSLEKGCPELFVKKV